MTSQVNTIQVAEGNPIVFFQEIQKHIQNGFYVTQDIGGYPVMGWPSYITLSEVSEPEIKNPLGEEIHTVVVEGWNILTFLLDFQNVVQQGFEMDINKVLFGDFKSFVFTKRQPVKVELKPTPKTQEEPAPVPPARKTRAKKGE